MMLQLWEALVEYGRRLAVITQTFRKICATRHFLLRSPKSPDGEEMFKMSKFYDASLGPVCCTTKIACKIFESKQSLDALCFTKG